jgi:hypothetical protein
MMMQERVMPGKRLDQRSNSWLAGVGRLKPGVTAEQAQARTLQR